ARFLSLKKDASKNIKRRSKKAFFIKKLRAQVVLNYHVTRKLYQTSVSSLLPVSYLVLIELSQPQAKLVFNMIGFVFGLLVALIFSYFALQNSEPVDLRFGQYIAPNIPVYIIAIISMVTGVILSLIFSLTESLSAAMTIFGKDRKIKVAENNLATLENKMHNLEMENARLKETRHYFARQSLFDKPNVFQRIRNRLSV
ncbi:hypothetical protein A2870_02140, partial [Candidatus Curtissbacteria bacterium RIFCSPHIGHO2_01_FULL_41_11]